MGKKDFSDLEDQIKDTIKSAFDAIDFAGIKKDIDSKTEGTINDAKIKIKDKSRDLNEKIKYKVKNINGNVNNIVNNVKLEKKVHRDIAKRPVGSISGILYTVFGAIGSGVLGISLIAYAIVTSIFGGFSTINYISLIIIIFFFAASMFFMFKGRSLRKRVKRFREYVNCLNGKDYCTIEEFAASIGMKNKFVVKDLKKMIELDMFPQGHIDDKQTYFMLNNEVYNDYLHSQEALKKRKEEELKRQEKFNEESNDPVKKELRDTIEMGKTYIEQIKSVNDDIQQEEISNKLYRLQSIVSQIFKYVESNPKKLSEVNKFTNHYLPMTLKLVNSYKELHDQPVQGVNIRNAKMKLKKL